MNLTIRHNNALCGFVHQPAYQTMSSTGLPPGWTIRVSLTHSKEYFYNSGTKESSWEPPFGSEQKTLDQYLKKFKENSNQPLVGPDGKIRVSHLLIKNNTSRKPKLWKCPDGITLSRDESIKILKGHQAKILSGEEKLGDLAATESDCSSHAQNGDLGFFGKGQMQSRFEEAAFALHVGGISDIIETDSGVHLIERTG